MKNLTKHIFISDIHGCYVEFKKILQVIKKQNYQKQRIFCLGDLIHKGPHSIKVVSLARKEKITIILGNHEINYFKGLKKENFWALDFQKKIGIKNHEYLRRQHLYIEHKRFIALHAGIDARNIKTTENPKEYAKKISALLKKSSATTLSTIREIGETAWHQHYKGEKPIIYGHWAKQGIHITKNTVGLDSGCVYGNRLSAYVLEEKKIFSVCAEKTYVKTEQISDK